MRRSGGIAASPSARERLLARGVAALAPAELLALVLRAGTAEAGALAVAERLLARFGTIGGLLAAAPADLARVRGVGPAKAVAIAAVGGLLGCFHGESIRAGRVIASSEATLGYLRYRIGRRRREVFGCLLLNARNRLIADEEIARGTVNRACVYPREVIRAAIRHNASALILYHNHPSGVASPSSSDIDVTRRIKSLLDELDVDLLDHVVIGGREHCSFAEAGMLE